MAYRYNMVKSHRFLLEMICNANPSVEPDGTIIEDDVVPIQASTMDIRRDLDTAGQTPIAQNWIDRYGFFAESCYYWAT